MSDAWILVETHQTDAGMGKGEKMCFKYEEIYPGACWDYMEWGMGDRNIGDGSLLHLLEDEYGVSIDWETFKGEFFRFMEQMHERGIIKPKPKPEEAA